MSTEQTPEPSAQTAEPSNVVLQRFFETSASARRAASHLKSAAQVAVKFTDVPGDFHFALSEGKPRFFSGPAQDPDFELTMAPGAVTAIAAQPDAEVGDLGILFFQHIVASDPQSKIRVKLHSGLLKLTMRGWLGVMASGGTRVIGWMASKGLKGPSAIASALSRLRKG